MSATVESVGGRVRGGTGVIVAGIARTPIGSLGGSLASLSATELGGIAIRGALQRAGVAACEVQACYMGHVLTAGVGQSPARQAATAGGLGPSVVCSGVNKVCSSGLKAVSIACMEIQLGCCDVIVAGGMESMSNCPYLVREARFGARHGDRVLVDSMVHDGLMDPLCDCHVGMHAERCAEKYGISREDQDHYAAESYRRGLHARNANLFVTEIVPVTVPGPAGPVVVISDDELSRTPISSLKDKKPAFKKGADQDGTVTSGNSSPLNDGAAAVVLMSKAKAEALGVKPLAHILGFGDAETASESFTTAPSLSLPVALSRAGVEIDEVDLFELNEAFAVVALVNSKLLGLSSEKVNVYGGAVALGHPLGCSGARILVTLINAMLRKQSRIGAAAVCNGGGGSTALVVELWK